MSSLRSEFAEAETGVFWDIVDCPVPDELSVELVCKNIKSALAEDGYGGKVTIKAYCDTKKSKAFKSSGIELVRAGDRDSRHNRMVEDLMLFAVDHKPSNLMLISQDMSTDSLCVQQLLFLKEENRNLLLAQIDDVTGELSASISSIWYWKDLSKGGKPAFQSGTSQLVTSEFAQAATGVFWDIVDCEIPNELSLELVCENIKSALADDGYGGKVSIKAYCDTKKSQAAMVSAFKSFGIGIKLVRAGDKRARHNAMLKDILFFAIVHKPSSLMVVSQDISKDVLFVEHLLTLKDKNRNLLVAQIDDVTGDLLSRVSSRWYWTDLANGGKPAFQSIMACRDGKTSGIVADDGYGGNVSNKRRRPM